MQADWKMRAGPVCKPAALALACCTAQRAATGAIVVCMFPAADPGGQQQAARRPLASNDAENEARAREAAWQRRQGGPLLLCRFGCGFRSAAGPVADHEATCPERELRRLEPLPRDDDLAEETEVLPEFPYDSGTHGGALLRDVVRPAGGPVGEGH